MISRLVARPSAVLRCVVCHDELARRHLTCPECSTTLHPDCVERPGDCPTLGCTHRFSRPTPRPPVTAPGVEARIFWVPAILTFLWPAWFLGGVLLRDALGLGHTFMGPSLDYVLPILLFALGLGPAVGHLILAPMAPPGGHHRRARNGAATGFGLSLVAALVIGVLSYMSAALG